MKKNIRIDLMKIGKIHTKAQLKKYHINSELLNGNYLFHYLILTNNLTGLKLYTHPIYRNNTDGLNGFMLAAKEKKYEILDYFIKKYTTGVDKDLVYIKNRRNMNFVHFLSPEDPEYIELIKNNPKINWVELFSLYSNAHINGIDILFLRGSYSTIKKMIEIVDFDYKSYISQPYHFNLLVNDDLSNSQIIKLFDLLETKDINILNYSDDIGYDVSFPIVLKEDDDNLSLVKYIVEKKGEKLDKYSPITANHIFEMAYKLGIKKNNYIMAEYLFDNIMKHHNYDETDSKGNNLVHFILKLRMSSKGNYNIEKKILENYNGWNIMNMDKQTPLDYIINLDYKKYHKFVKSRPEILNKNINKKWLKYLKTLPIIKNSSNIKMIDTPYAHSNMFKATFTDMAIFAFYLNEKYNINNEHNLYFPIYNGKDVTPNWDDDMLLPDNMLRYNNNFPWLIIWNNENSYWIHPHLNKLIIEHKKQYKAAIVFLSLRLPDGGLHAILIFYDFTRNVIERFDPYGNTSATDSNMDEILEEKLTYGTDMKYCSPECYFPVSGFQTLSDENNIMNQKLGDFGGYCLAWCLWYVEHKMINMKVNPKDLIRKTINRFMQMNIKPMEYIRNYANYISKFRLKYLQDIGIPKNLTSNEILNHTNNNIINKSIIKYHQQTMH